MKKTIIISAIALCFSIVTLHAKTNTIKNSCEIETVSINYGINSFCMAIVKGDIETVKKLINLGENINKKSNGMTPSMYAAKFNRVEILELLISKGADLKVKSEKRMTALNYAKLSNANDTHALIKKHLKKK